MNAGIVRVSIIAMVVLATIGITSAQETAKLPAIGPVLSNTGHDADAYGVDEGYWRPERRCGTSLPPIVILTN
jgi:hypothetical protein